GPPRSILVPLLAALTVFPGGGPVALPTGGLGRPASVLGFPGQTPGARQADLPQLVKGRLRVRGVGQAWVAGPDLLLAHPVPLGQPPEGVVGFHPDEDEGGLRSLLGRQADRLGDRKSVV